MNLHALSWFNLLSKMICSVYSYIGLVKILADKGPVSAPGPTKGIPNTYFFMNFKYIIILFIV